MYTFDGEEVAAAAVAFILFVQMKSIDISPFYLGPVQFQEYNNINNTKSETMRHDQVTLSGK